MLLRRHSRPARVSGSASPRRASRPIPDFVAADTMGILYACRLGKSNRNREPGTGSRRPGAGRAGWSTANPGVGGAGGKSEDEDEDGNPGASPPPAYGKAPTFPCLRGSAIGLRRVLPCYRLPESGY